MCRDRTAFRSTAELAQRLGVTRVNLFSGCPGDSESATYPNWVTCAWLTEYGELLEWQWATKVIPYWREAAAFAADRGVRLCFEMHPGFVVYNPRTLLRRILSALRLAGYDDVISIEHEDALLSIEEGFRRAVGFLRGVMPSEPALTGAWWT